MEGACIAITQLLNSLTLKKARKSMSKPGVFIRSLEDSPMWLDQQLVRAYLSTEYQVLCPDASGPVLTIGQPESAFQAFLETTDSPTCALITAYNPYSVLLTTAENTRRNLALEKDLASCSSLILPTLHVSHDGLWPPEAGFCACGIAAATALRITRKYEQNALVWWEKGRMAALWWVATDASG